MGLHTLRIGTRIAVVFASITLLFAGLLWAFADPQALARPVFTVAVAGAVLAGGLLVWRLARSILLPLKRTVSIARRVTVGDLSFDAHIAGTDEVSDLHRALKAMNDSLLSIVQDAKGKPFIRAFISQAHSGAPGWVDYQWANPVTGVLEDKTTYVQRVDDVVIGCEIYKG